MRLKCNFHISADHFLAMLAMLGTNAVMVPLSRHEGLHL